MNQTFEGEIELPSEDEEELNDLAQDYEEKAKAATEAEHALRLKLLEIGSTVKGAERTAGAPARAASASGPSPPDAKSTSEAPSPGTSKRCTPRPSRPANSRRTRRSPQICVDRRPPYC
ncbi:hypothetical protein [Streptomyces smyrnaeus]|uniref:hypothetical protein n=1 Tax=Streptomyces smyrnaeus TaxID=1387713 RepID=UPI001FD7DF51|nr:hypothetical protein [Streptomyces smyrnaeus]